MTSEQDISSGVHFTAVSGKPITFYGKRAIKMFHIMVSGKREKRF
jgi:hypothetical protein